MVWNLFPFKSDFSFWKSQKPQGAKSGLLGGWVTWVIWCFTQKLCTRRDAWVGTLLWWSCQSPVAHSCSLLNHPNSFHGGMLNVEIWCMFFALLTQSFWMRWPHTTLNGVYCPHWLVQWSRHCSHMCLPVHSPWLPGYIDVAQTILIISTMAGVFLDRPVVPVIFEIIGK